MSVLLNDENLCSTEFCRMLYRRESNEWRFSVVVSDVIESRSVLGHADYRLVVTAVPRNGIEFEVRKFTLLTRFRQLHKLWTQLAKIHQQLYLHGTFPEFAQPRFFGKSEPDVIIERVEGTKRFLNFIFESDVLCKSKVLHQFFEQAVEMEHTPDVTEPIETTPSTAAQDILSETPPSSSLEEVN
uniref:PX domain-containing protein n=1 Tax=Steinernema glaseri TaxID=37863 RepID=A0A1I7YZ22_9BILA